MAQDERIITIDLTGAYKHTRTKRTDRAVKILRESVARHLKAAVGDVRLSEKLNARLWEHSRQYPPRRIKIKVETKDGLVNARLQDEKADEKRPEPKMQGRPGAAKGKGKAATTASAIPAAPAIKTAGAKEDKAAGGKETPKPESAPKSTPAPGTHKHESEKSLEQEKKHEQKPHQHGEYDKH